MDKSKLPKQETVPYVDIPKFMGNWFVISAIPTYFEKDAFQATEAYTWNEKKDRIDIDYRHKEGSMNGKEKSIPQKAFIYNKETNSEWRVQPFWPLKFAYLVIDLAPDYSDTVIGVPDRDHVWIMARSRVMNEDRYNELVEKIRKLGYDTSKLIKVPQ
ncbi:MAG: lipocalin family protein [Bdellovibrionota bacterium]